MSTDTTVSSLRQRMIEDMAARKLGPHSQRSHIYSCRRLAAFLKRSPDTATADDIRRFQLHLVEAGLSICNRNRIMTGVKFLFRVALRLADYASYARHLRRRLEDFVAKPDPTRWAALLGCLRDPSTTRSSIIFSSTRRAKCRWPTSWPPERQRTISCWWVIRCSWHSRFRVYIPATPAARHWPICSMACADRGIFLPVTRRLHPLICDYISRVVYDCRLGSDKPAARQQLLLPRPRPPLVPAGLRFAAVAHAGNSQSSAEEGRAILDVHRALIGQAYQDRDGDQHPIGAADILVVTPYNAQVNLLTRMLPAGARIGTVDKFQGQEAPACLISMATSSADELPRNIEFLFSVNRLNVAISRAQALAVVFASPRLLDVPCRTVEQMRLVNALAAVKDYESRSSGLACLAKELAGGPAESRFDSGDETGYHRWS
jgi:hypothetical protein